MTTRREIAQAIARAEEEGDDEAVATLRGRMRALETTAASPLPENTDGPRAERRTP